MMKDCERDFDADCGYLEGHNPVSIFCVKACRLAHLDYFYEAELSLQQAAAFVRRDEEERCVEVYRKYIKELRRDRESSLMEEVESALRREMVEIDENLCHQVEGALIILQNLIPWRETQRLVKRWREHYQTSVQERKKAFQKLLKQARQLVKQDKFAEATQVLDEAHALADRNGKRSIRRVERRIQQHLSRILEQARTLAGQDHFDEALQNLRDAREQLFTAGDKFLQVEAVEQEVEKTRWQRVEILTDELEILLSKNPEELTDADLKEGQDVTERLKGVHPNPVELEELIQEWQTHSRKGKAHLDLVDTRLELEKLWKHPLKLASYDKALALAHQRIKAYPDEPLFRELLLEAERRREDAYGEESELTTAAAQGSFGVLIDKLERLWKEGRETLPKYSHQGDQQALVPVAGVPAKEAIAHLQNLAQEYDDHKADEYLQRAQVVVSDDPLAAEKWLEEIMGFEYLSPAKREEIQKYKERVVVLARQRHQRALELVKAAQERRTEDIVAAWQLVQEAHKLAPGLREVMRTRDYLRPWLVVHLDKILRKAEDAIWEGEHEKAAKVANYVLGNIQSEPSSFENALQKAQHILQRCRYEEVE